MITITYCVECEYLHLAQRLADGIEASLGVTPDLAEGHGGIFAVSVGEREVFNNLKSGGQVPSDAHLIEMVRSNLEPAAVSTTRQPLLHDVMNPMGFPPQIEPTSMAPRPSNLKGKTIYLVDARFDDSDRFLQQMQHWFEEHMPETQTVFVSKSGVYTEEDWDLWATIKAKGDAMIMGVGH
jgi:predicted Rdx family selenoprotein